MKLHELKTLLRQHPERLVRIDLPDGQPIPAAYHLTEVGQVSKVFIDCGGKVHSQLRCVLQTWVGADREHRLNARRFADILDLGRAVVATDTLEVEVEHGQTQATQYPIVGWALAGEQHLVLDLATRATDCLAKARCGEDACGCEDEEPKFETSAHARPVATACCA